MIALHLDIDIIEESGDWSVIHYASGLKDILEESVRQGLQQGCEKSILPAYEVTLVLSDNETIRSLNKKYREKDKPTNVLSFPTPQKDNPFLGDVIFSLSTIREEAQKDKKNLEHHFLHLAVHGVLHLLGFDHNTEEEAKDMEQLEVAVLSKFGIPNPY